MIFFGCTFYGLTARPKEKLQRSVSSHHFCFQGRTASFGSLEGRNISPKKKTPKINLVAKLGDFRGPVSHFRIFGFFALLFGPRVRDDIELITETALAQGIRFKLEKQSSNSCNKQSESDMLYYSLQLVIKGILAIFPQRLRDSDACQRNASCKGTFPNGRHRLRDSDAGQRTAIFKGSVPNGRLRVSDACQRLAISKGSAPNKRHRLGDCDGCQTSATVKGIVCNGCHRLRDSDAFQRNAVYKGSVPNDHH